MFAQNLMIVNYILKRVGPRLPEARRKSLDRLKTALEDESKRIAGKPREVVNEKILDRGKKIVKSIAALGASHDTKTNR